MLFTEMENQNYDKALEYAHDLNIICSRSPVLNYTFGQIFKAKGDDAKALYYLQRATLFTEEFAVKGELLERLWAERYEAEHPEATPQRVMERDQEIKTLRDNNAQLESDLLNIRMQFSQTTLTDSYEEQKRYAVGLWTGVTFGGTGLIMTIVGAALLARSDNQGVKFDKSDKKDVTVHVNEERYTYWGILGAGIGLAVAGAVIAGINGYFYDRVKNSDPDTSVNLAISPMGIGLTGRF